MNSAFQLNFKINFMDLISLNILDAHLKCNYKKKPLTELFFKRVIS